MRILSRFRPLPLRAVIRRALRAAAAAERVGPAAVGVLVCDDAEIRDLNRRYAGEDHATDVLSFAAGPAPDPRAGDPRELGDIVLSLEHLRSQAEAAGRSVEEEAATLSIHGFLHLLGYDHATRADERAMFARTAEILASAGLAPRARA